MRGAPKAVHRKIDPGNMSVDKSIKSKIEHTHLKVTPIHKFS